MPANRHSLLNVLSAMVNGQFSDIPCYKSEKVSFHFLDMTHQVTFERASRDWKPNQMAVAWGFDLLVLLAPQGFGWHVKSTGSCLNALPIFSNILDTTMHFFAIATTHLKIYTTSQKF